MNNNMNKAKILDDYYKCIGAFENCKTIYNEKDKFSLKSEDSEEMKHTKKGREEDLLSELGKVGEKAFKYILGLEYLNTCPNVTPEEFELFFRKSSVLKDFARKKGIHDNNPEMTELINYQDDNNQKAHNFDYWYTVMDTITPEYAEKFKTYLQYNYMSNMLIQYCSKYDGFIYEEFDEFSLPFRAAICPSMVEEGLESIPKFTLKQLNTVIIAKRRAIKESGDIFTRLRYSSNNKEKKEFNLDTIYNLIEDIINYIKFIHANKEDLNFNLDISFAKEKAIKYSEILGKSSEEINKIFDLQLHPLDTDSLIFNKNYTAKGIKEILDLGVSKQDLFRVICNSLHANNIKAFNAKGIYDFEEMREILNNEINEDLGYPEYEENRYKK